MAAVFSPDIIARVKDETDIVEIVRHHVSLKQAGAVFKGLCPFHKEKTPSFIVTPGRNRWHCFGCGAGGDVISFLMEVEGVTFPEAVEILARPLDIDLSDWLRPDEGEGERRAFHRANETAAGIWKDALWDEAAGRQARRYLLDRGFGEKVLRDFDVGWAPPGGDWTQRQLAQAGVDLDLAVQADLLRHRPEGGAFAYFRGRIIFPIRNISRQVAGFGGRVIDQGEPKYLNSADSTFFSKGHLLYGFDSSRMAVSREKSALLVEGYLDLLALAQVGFNNVVATCGTAFTPDQAKLIRRGAPGVVLLFDGDKAGLKATVRAADTALKCGLEPTVVTLPRGMDPADLAMERGRDGMLEVLGSGIGYVPFMKAQADRREGDRTVQEKAVRMVLDTVSGIADPLRREYVLMETAQVFGLDLQLLRSMSGEEPEPARPRKQETVPGDRRAPAGEPGARDPGTSRRTGPNVRRSLARVNAPSIEADMFAHILMDATGTAARVFLAERSELELESPQARVLGDEIAAWEQAHLEGGPESPKDFVLQRWNSVGDREYRSFISRLVDLEPRPAGTDYRRITRDCLQRLQADRQSRLG